MRLPSMDLGLPQNQHLWDLHGPDDAHVAIHHQPRLVTRGMSTLRDAALAGVGIVQLPTMLVRDRSRAANWSTCCRNGRRGPKSSTPCSPRAAACCLRSAR